MNKNVFLFLSIFRIGVSFAETITVNSFDTSGTTGIVTNNGNGTFDYDPNGQFEDLDEDQQAIDTFTYTLDDDADGRFAIDSGTGVVTVAGAIDREADGPFGQVS